MTREIYLAGGCFWGTQHYIKQIEGIIQTETGYANGTTTNPTYEEVYTDTTNFAETVRVVYDDSKIALRTILRLFFKAIDPTSKNKQGEDVGTRYRTGIYYTDKADKKVIDKYFDEVRPLFPKEICVEKEALKNFYKAEEYHQNYLSKNPQGYCHLPVELFQYSRNFKPINAQIHDSLLSMQDLEYKNFHAKLIPGIDEEQIIGVRIPILRKYSKEIAQNTEVEDFLTSLPHNYYEENNLHAFVIAQIRDFDKCVEAVNDFLPHINNWATCDSLRPAVFGKHKDKLLKWIKKWMASDHEYTVRFGIEMLMTHYLDEDFSSEHLKLVSSIKRDEYYIKMMIAWYFATALAKQYSDSIRVIESRILDKWTHNKTIQKAIESYRVREEHKNYLRSLSIKEITKP